MVSPGRVGKPEGARRGLGRLVRRPEQDPGAARMAVENPVIELKGEAQPWVRRPHAGCRTGMSRREHEQRRRQRLKAGSKQGCVQELARW